MSRSSISASRKAQSGRTASEQIFVGQPVKLSRTPSKIVATPPDSGQHTDEVLKEFGFADKEIAELHAAKAV